MNYVHEYAQIAAVAIPCLAIVAMNVYLWLGGERGTLVMPSFEALPSLVRPEQLRAPAPIMTAAQQAMAKAVPANDVQVREAA